MNKKVTLIILIAIIVIGAVILGGYQLKKKMISAPLPQAVVTEPVKIVNPDQAKQQEETKIDPAKQNPIQAEKKESVIVGKVRSMNEKQIYLELADGKGAAININASTPVKNEGDEKIGNLSLVKVQAMVSIKVDGKNDAIDILIKK